MGSDDTTKHDNSVNSDMRSLPTALSHIAIGLPYATLITLSDIIITLLPYNHQVGVLWRWPTEIIESLDKSTLLRCVKVCKVNLGFWIHIHDHKCWPKMFMRVY